MDESECLKKQYGIDIGLDRKKSDINIFFRQRNDKKRNHRRPHLIIFCFQYDRTFINKINFHNAALYFFLIA
jgi:hypothetical protein